MASTGTPSAAAPPRPASGVTAAGAAARHIERLMPDADVERRAARVLAAGGGRALDLGCGGGRHALMLARLGFATAALDDDDAGIRRLDAASRTEGLAIDARVGPITNLPYSDAAFDYVVAYDVIDRGDATVVRRMIAEIRRVLKPGGICQATMPARTNTGSGRGAAMTSDTVVREGGPETAGPRFCCHAAGARGLFTGFWVMTLEEREGGRPGCHRWHMTAERLR